MKPNNFLTTWNYAIGILLNKAESFHADISAREQGRFRGYKIVQSFKEQGPDDNCGSGAYLSPNGEKVFIKHLHCRWKNLPYRRLLNEASILDVLKNFSYVGQNGVSVRFPELIDISEKDGELVMVREYADGRMLSEFQWEVQSAVLYNCLEFLRSASETLGEKFRRMIPRRNFFLSAAVFPLFVVLATRKDWRRIGEYLKMALVFSKSIWCFSFSSSNYVLVHRDLHPKNIVLKGERIFILDPDSCVLAEPETEIAFVAWQWSAILAPQKIVEFLKKLLPGRKQKEKFIALSIYYIFQSLAIFPRGSKGYREAESYREIFMKEIMPQLAANSSVEYKRI